MQLVPFIKHRCFRIFAHSASAHFMNIQARCLFAVVLSMFLQPAFSSISSPALKNLSTIFSSLSSYATEVINCGIPHCLFDLYLIAHDCYLSELFLPAYSYTRSSHLFTHASLYSAPMVSLVVITGIAISPPENKVATQENPFPVCAHF